MADCLHKVSEAPIGPNSATDDHPAEEFPAKLNSRVVPSKWVKLFALSSRTTPKDRPKNSGDCCSGWSGRSFQCYGEVELHDSRTFKGPARTDLDLAVFSVFFAVSTHAEVRLQALQSFVNLR